MNDQSKLETTGSRKKSLLLPSSFKIVGVILSICSVFPLLIVKFRNLKLNVIQRNLVQYISVDILVIGLFIIVCSRSKQENDYTLHIRIQSFAFAAVTCFLQIIFKPLTDLFFSSSVISSTAQNAVLYVLITYLLFFYSQIEAKGKFKR